MNNNTIAKYDVTLKLRGDHVYDLYINNEWIGSYGNCDRAFRDARDIVNDASRLLWEV